MNSNLFASATRTIKVVKATVASALLLVIISCGGGGGTTPVTDVTTTNGGLRTLSADFISRKAVAYGAYRTATGVGHPFKTHEIDDPASSAVPKTKLTLADLDANGQCIPDPADRANEVVSEANIKQDMQLLAAAGVGLVRLFDSSLMVSEKTLRVIQQNNLNIKVMLGAYINNYSPSLVDIACKVPPSEAQNNEELARLVALANSYKDIVLAVSVGNENMVSWTGNPVPPEKVAGYIKAVRSQITQPVTSDDNWAYYAAADRVLLDAIDFASVHTYAMVDTHYLPKPWDWRQLGEKDLKLRAAAMMNAALVSTKGDYNAARTFLDTRGHASMPIVIGETGWMNKDPGDGWYRFIAHPVNQKMYLDRLTSWANEGKTGAGPKNVFYFSAFDEPWKGNDDGWGLFNVKREARYALSDVPLTNNQVLSNGATWKLELPEVTCIRPSGAQYTASEALYYDYAQANTAISSSRYTLFADSVTSGEARTACDMWWDAFSGDSAGYKTDSSEYLPSDAFFGLQITPKPKDYGWGLLRHSRSDITENLSAFEAGGNLNFSIKTNYVGKIKIGISTDTYDRGGAEAYIVLASGSNGYRNDNSWSNVSIPLSAFKAVNPKIDFQYVLSRFIIADVYKDTGNTPGQTNVINLDAIYWSK